MRDAHTTSPHEHEISAANLRTITVNRCIVTTSWRPRGVSVILALTVWTTCSVLRCVTDYGLGAGGADVKFDAVRGVGVQARPWYQTGALLRPRLDRQGQSWPVRRSS